jgi:hypothetical protein
MYKTDYSCADLIFFKNGVGSLHVSKYTTPVLGRFQRFTVCALAARVN